MLRLFFPWGLPLLALSTLPWLYLLVKRGGREALYVFVWHNQVLRFFSPGADHSEPPWYYLPLLFEILAPWVIFLPPALIRLFKPLDRQRRGDPQRQYLLSLLIVPFVLLSAASGKRRLYLLPLMPGCAIVIAVWLVGAWHEARARWEAVWRHWGLMLVALLPLGSWAGALFLGLRCGTGIAVALAGLIVAGVAITYLFRSPEWPHPHRLEGFAVALLIFAYAAVLSPPIWSFMEQKKGYLPLKEMLERHVPTGAPLYLYMPGEREQGAVSFYRHAIAPVLQSQEELARVLGISPRNYVLIQKRIISGQLELLFLSSAEVVASADVPRRQQVLLKGKELP